MESPTPPPSPTVPVAGPLTGEDRLWGALAHFSAFAMYFSGIGHVIGPMIIWLWKRDTNPFVAAEAREAMNFNISVTIYAAVALVLCFVVIGIPLLVLIHAFQVVCIVIGGLKAGDGRPFLYPLNLRLVK